MFVRWECGCKGIKLGETNWVIYSCDGEEGLSMYKRPMENSPASSLRREEYEALSEEERQKPIPKKCKPLSEEEIEKLLQEIGKLMSDGQGYRCIRSELKRMLRD